MMLMVEVVERMDRCHVDCECHVWGAGKLECF